MHIAIESNYSYFLVAPSLKGGKRRARVVTHREREALWEHTNDAGELIPQYHSVNLGQ